MYNLKKAPSKAFLSIEELVKLSKEETGTKGVELIISCIIFVMSNSGIVEFPKSVESSEFSAIPKVELSAEETLPVIFDVTI
jgi:hypothetical protein